MALFLDDREQDILPYLRRHDVPLSVQRLEYGDAHWCGAGPDGPMTTMYAVERKKVRDLVNGMRDRRLSGHQLRGMRRTYDRACLVVEGPWRAGEGGDVEVPENGAWRPLVVGRSLVMYRSVAAYLLTLSWVGGVTIWRTGGTAETAALYATAYRWTTEKEWSEHHSHDQVYAPVTVESGRPYEPTTAERWAAQLPGVDRRARLVASYCPTPLDLAMRGAEPATIDQARREIEVHGVREWAKIKPRTEKEKGLGIGKGIAEEVVRAITTPNYRRRDGVKQTHKVARKAEEED